MRWIGIVLGPCATLTTVKAVQWQRTELREPTGANERIAWPGPVTSSDVWSGCFPA
jgi:hypothetical protein